MYSKHFGLFTGFRKVAFPMGFSKLSKAAKRLVDILLIHNSPKALEMWLVNVLRRLFLVSFP